jgi:hypothetical protein
MTFEELEAEALKLDPAARAKLAERLTKSLEEISENEKERLWIQEAMRRSRELRESQPLPGATLAATTAHEATREAAPKKVTAKKAAKKASKKKAFRTRRRPPKKVAPKKSAVRRPVAKKTSRKPARSRR